MINNQTTTHNNYSIESVGREIALAYEQQNGRALLPLEKSEKHFGYDIKSIDPKTARVRFIELKTSCKPHMINRWLEEHEQQCLLKQGSFYYIYYILNIDIEKRTGKLIEFSSAEWQKYYKKVERKFWYYFPKNTGLDRAVEIKV